MAVIINGLSQRDSCAPLKIRLNNKILMYGNFLSLAQPCYACKYFTPFPNTFPCTAGSPFLGLGGRLLPSLPPQGPPATQGLTSAISLWENTVGGRKHSLPSLRNRMAGFPPLSLFLGSLPGVPSQLSAPLKPTSGPRAHLGPLRGSREMALC